MYLDLLIEENHSKSGPPNDGFPCVILNYHKKRHVPVYHFIWYDHLSYSMLN